MFGWIEIALLSTATILLVLAFVPPLKPYRSLFAGGTILMLLTALFPRAGNPFGQFLFGATQAGPRLPIEIFGFAWWILGAWLFTHILDLFLRRTFFPNNDEPHARRLFADLAAGLIYFLAFIGIIGTVFNEPVSTFLATSGIVAIVLGLALQNTLGDVLAGLAINIERPFKAGDWITLSDSVSGQVMQVNWRATRLRTWSHDMIVVPNSFATKTVVTNHSYPRGPHHLAIRLEVDFAISPLLVIDALKQAAKANPGISKGTTPEAFVCEFSHSLTIYELAFAIDSFAQAPLMKSEMLKHIAETFGVANIKIGEPATDIRIVYDRTSEVLAKRVREALAASPQ